MGVGSKSSRALGRQTERQSRNAGLPSPDSRLPTFFRWPWRLERRAVPSTLMRIAAPLLAAAAMLATGFILFTVLGKSPLAGFQVFFVEPLASAYGVGELALKATPLMLCALGLAIGF